VAALTGIVVAVGVFSFSRRTLPPSANASALSQRLSRITWDSSFSTEPALSPDGTLAVYASDRGGAGQLDLWLQRIAGGQPIRLTDDLADDREPAFSPDGGLIAFRSNRGKGGVYVMPTLGGDARLVAERGHDPRFSPDGSRIVYWEGPWLGGPRSTGSRLFVVPANGGQPTLLTDSFDVARTPAWSPSGNSVIFFGRKKDERGFDWWWLSLESHEAGATGVYDVLAANSLFGSTVNNTVAPAPDTLPAVWTPDGVLFSARLDNSTNLWRIKISEDNGEVIVGSLERLTSGAGSDMRATVDKVGRIAFQVETAAFTSLTLPLDSNSGQVLGTVTRRTFDFGLVDSRNSLDGSGRVLAYAKTQTGQSEIWLKDLATGQERHLATTVMSQLNPIISHDGTKVAYTVPEGGGNSGYVIPAAGGTSKKICEACNLQGWLSDNRRILALRPNGDPGSASVIDTATGSKQDALDDPSSIIGRLDPSPDDRWIVFNSVGGRIWIAPLRPGTPPSKSDWVPIHDPAPGSAERPCGWSPDGRLLYLLLENDGFRDLYAQRVDPIRGTPVGAPFIVQHLHDPRRRWGSTPYGTGIVRNAFVFTQTESEGSIWLLTPGSIPASKSTAVQPPANNTN
jgi:Tol biopolymer transport system component